MADGKKSYHEPSKHEKGKALLEAREVTGLDEEIALLRTRLHRFAKSENPDDGLILSAMNTLARALMAQARMTGGDSAETNKRIAAAIRQLGDILEEEQTS